MLGVTAIMLNGWILPIGGVASGRVCACSLCSRLVKHLGLFFNFAICLLALFFYLLCMSRLN